MTITSHQHALPAGTVLMEYRLSGLLGAGAFGITYLARDTHLDKEVAIKEYLPSAFAARAADGLVRAGHAAAGTATIAGAWSASARKRARSDASAIRTSCT